MEPLPRLEDVNFLEAIAPAQISDVFREIKESEEVKLKNLNFPLQDLSSIPPNTLSASIIRIEDEVNIREGFI